MNSPIQTFFAILLIAAKYSVFVYMASTVYWLHSEKSGLYLAGLRATGFIGWGFLIGTAIGIIYLGSYSVNLRKGQR